MMSATTQWQEIESKLAQLPEDDLHEVLDFLDYLAFKREKAQLAEGHLAEQKAPYRVVAKLEGILKDHPLTDEDLAAARKEMWRSLVD